MIVFYTQKRQYWLAGRYTSCRWDMPKLVTWEEDVVQKDLLKIRMAIEWIMTSTVHG